uniref:Uncharacterized protein n=1 Tax=Arundo donax TaxID=35708 RepID=A0A0A9DE15_ARUDO
MRALRHLLSLFFPFGSKHRHAIIHYFTSSSCKTVVKS